MMAGITQYFIDVDDLGGQGEMIDMSRLWRDTEIASGLRAGRKLVPVYAVDLAMGSDYGGCSVTRSNYQVLQERAMGWRALYGAHGSYGIVYRSIKAAQIVAAELDGYPLLDEDHHSHLEMDLHNEAWESYGADDFRRALVKADLVSDEVEPSGGRLLELWHAATERYNCGEAYQIETGCTVYYNVDRVVKCIAENHEKWAAELAELGAAVEG